MLKTFSFEELLFTLCGRNVYSVSVQKLCPNAWNFGIIGVMATSVRVTGKCSWVSIIEAEKCIICTVTITDDLPYLIFLNVEWKQC